jgi:hypothetical protein
MGGLRLLHRPLVDHAGDHPCLCLGTQVTTLACAFEICNTRRLKPAVTASLLDLCYTPFWPNHLAEWVWAYQQPGEGCALANQPRLLYK